MKIIYCWLCERDVPMLDEAEFAAIAELYDEAHRTVELYRRRHRASQETVPTELLWQPVRREYQNLTGVFEADPNVIMHHRASLYGPPCSGCGKNLRTPDAVSCAICGHKRESAQ